MSRASQKSDAMPLLADGSLFLHFEVDSTLFVHFFRQFRFFFSCGKILNHVSLTITNHRKNSDLLLRNIFKLSVESSSICWSCSFESKRSTHVQHSFSCQNLQSIHDRQNFFKYVPNLLFCPFYSTFILIYFEDFLHHSWLVT